MLVAAEQSHFLAGTFLSVNVTRLRLRNAHNVPSSVSPFIMTAANATVAGIDAGKLGRWCGTRV